MFLFIKFGGVIRVENIFGVKRNCVIKLEYEIKLERGF